MYEILSTASYGKRKRAEIGIERLLEEDVFTAAFPMHDVSILFNSHKKVEIEIFVFHDSILVQICSASFSN